MILGRCSIYTGLQRYHKKSIKCDPTPRVQAHGLHCSIPGMAKIAHIGFRFDYWREDRIGRTRGSTRFMRCKRDVGVIFHNTRGADVRQSRSAGRTYRTAKCVVRGGRATTDSARSINHAQIPRPYTYTKICIRTIVAEGSLCLFRYLCWLKYGASPIYTTKTGIFIQVHLSLHVSAVFPLRANKTEKP